MGCTVLRADPPHTRHAVGAAGDAPAAAPALSHDEARAIEYSRLMAQHAGLRNEIRTLKKLLWREVARHRRAHRYRDANDIEYALRILENR